MQYQSISFEVGYYQCKPFQFTGKSCSALIHLLRCSLYLRILYFPIHFIKLPIVWIFLNMKIFRNSHCSSWKLVPNLILLLYYGLYQTRDHFPGLSTSSKHFSLLFNGGGVQSYGILNIDIVGFPSFSIRTPLLHVSSITATSSPFYLSFISFSESHVERR